MVIECPYCSTRFRLDERSLGARRPTLRCSRCRRTFPLPPAPDPEDDDAFAFEDDTDLEDETQIEGATDFAGDGEDDDEMPAPRAAPRPAAPRGEQFALPIGRDDDAQPSLFGDREEHHLADDDDYSIGAPPPLFVDDDLDPAAAAAEDEDDDDDETAAEFPEEPAVRDPVQIKSLLAFIALVVGSYAVLAWTLRSEPQWMRSLMQQVPLIGSEINAIALGREIVLDGLDGRYERTKEGKLIFLITGKARNEHHQAVRGIRVEFQLLGDGGVLLARQSTTCGNAMRPELVRDLTEEQVRILRRLETRPPEEPAVKPGESCPIVSIFMDVAENATSFSGEVVQARRLS